MEKRYISRQSRRTLRHTVTGVANKDVRKLIRQAERQGWRVTYLKGGHVMLCASDGEADEWCHGIVDVGRVIGGCGAPPDTDGQGGVLSEVSGGASAPPGARTTPRIRGTTHLGNVGIDTEQPPLEAGCGGPDAQAWIRRQVIGVEFEISIDRAWPGVVPADALDEIHVAMVNAPGVIDPVCSGGRNEVGVSVGVQADTYDQAYTTVSTALDAAIASALARAAA